jgi:hypothetical protein
MKKTLILIFVLILTACTSYAQLKVTFSLTNRTISAGILSYDVIATVPAGQHWAVGAATIRFNLGPNPAGALSIHPDDPVVNANPNISNANGYQPMKTIQASSSIMSMNIVTLNTSGFYRFNTGTYTLGKIRFNVLTTPFATDSVKFRVNPPFTSGLTTVNDSIVPLVYGTSFSVTQPVITDLTHNTTVPKEFQLYQNYPNPFNPTTSIRFDVPKSSIVKIKVYDLTGKEITELVNQEMTPGVYETTWEASNFASGVYFYKITAGDYTKVLKMVLIK